MPKNSSQNFCLLAFVIRSACVEFQTIPKVITNSNSNFHYSNQIIFVVSSNWAIIVNYTPLDAKTNSANKQILAPFKFDSKRLCRLGLWQG